MQAIQQVRGDLIAIDGKTHRRTHDHSNGKAALHLVSAWAAANRLVLGQVAVDDKSNEITAIPLLLDLLDLDGCTITIDAPPTDCGTSYPPTAILPIAVANAVDIPVS